MGAIDYEHANDQRPADEKETEPYGPASESASTFLANRSAVRADHAVKFSYLPGTQAEMEAIAKLMQEFRPQAKLRELSATQASEANIKTLCRDPARIMHLATHGYFAAETLLAARLVHQEGRMLGLDDDRNRVVGMNPDLLSGIVFAGANVQHNPLDPARPEDGILTSLEVQSLPLEKTELVVLSACETGLGATAGGEGILGLQRSFQIAGAKTVVSSLWRVDDYATQALMTEFYRKIWEKKLGKLDALRQAQLTMLNHYNPETNTISRAPEVSLANAKVIKPDEADSTHKPTRLPPKYWAAFSLSGDWR